MDFTEERKKNLENNLVETMLAGLDREEITQEDLPVIATFILDRIDTITSQDDLMQFLRDIAAQWQIFSRILVLESGELKEQKEGQVAQGVLSLAKVGKIEEAISLAKTMTNTTQ